MKSKLILLLITSLLFMEHGFTQPSDSVKAVLLKQYDKVWGYSEGLTIVSYIAEYKHVRYGYVDDAGKVAFPNFYDKASDFKDGLALVEVLKPLSYEKGKYSGGYLVSGFIDKTGTPVVPFEYRRAYSFSDGLAAVQVDLGEKWGFVDKTGKMIIPLKYDYVGMFSEGLAVVGKQRGKYYKFGYINTSGEEVIPLKYNSAAGFSDGLARVKAKDGIGYIDKTGATVIPFDPSEKGSFSSGLAIVDGGYMNKRGEIIIPNIYTYTKPFTGDFAYVNRYGGSWSAINTKGELLPNESYLGAVLFYLEKSSDEEITIKIETNTEVNDYNVPDILTINFLPEYQSVKTVKYAYSGKITDIPVQEFFSGKYSKEAGKREYSEMWADGIYPVLLPPGKYVFSGYIGRDKHWEGKFTINKNRCRLERLDWK